MAPLYAQVGGPFLGPRKIGARIFKPEAEFESERGGLTCAKPSSAKATPIAGEMRIITLDGQSHRDVVGPKR